MHSVYAIDPNTKRYFFGRLSHDESISVLTRAGLRDGLFLLREKIKETGHYALSICCNNEIKHYVIDRLQNHNVKLDKSAEFPGPIELIHFLRNNNAGLCTKPNEKCSRRYCAEPIGYLFIEKAVFNEAVKDKIRERGNDVRIRYKYERLVLADIHSTQSWFRRNVNSSYAEQLFQEHGYEDGKFMLRSKFEASKLGVKYRLSVCHQRKVYHHAIIQRGKKYFFEADRDNKFEFLAQMIDYYGRTRGCLETLLTKPFDVPSDEVYICDSNENYKMCTLDDNFSERLLPFIQIVSCVAFGPISNVYHAFYKEQAYVEGKHVALKFLNHYSLEHGTSSVEKEILSELEGHSNIIKTVDLLKNCNISIKEQQHTEEVKVLYGGFNQGNILKIINHWDTKYTNRVRNFTVTAIEYSRLGTLNNFIRNRRDIQNTQIFQYIRQVLNALEFIASKNIVHRHVSTRNVLLFENNCVKLSGFGLARKADSVSVRGNPEVWPIAWYPPEAFDNIFSEKTDVYSFGILLWEAFSRGLQPYNNRTLITRDEVNEFISDLQSGVLSLPKPNGCPDKVYELMQLCWQRDYNQRPSFEQVSSEYDAIFGEYIITDEERL